MPKKTLSKKEIEHLAKLSALTLSDQEIEKYETQLSETIDYIENLKELKTEGVKEAHSVIDSKDVFFEDGESCTRMLTEKEATLNAKNVKNNQFSVKKIL